MSVRGIFAACNTRWRDAVTAVGGRNTAHTRSDEHDVGSAADAADAASSSASAAAAASSPSAVSSSSSSAAAPPPRPAYASIWSEYAAMGEIDAVLPRFSVQSSFVCDCAHMARAHNARIPAHAGGWSTDGLLRLMTYNVFMWQRPAPSATARNADNKMAIVLTILRANPDVCVLQEVIETCTGYKGSNSAPRVAPLFEREGYTVYFQPLLQHGPPDHYMGNMLLVRSDLIRAGRVKSQPLSMQFEHALTRGQGEPRGYVCVAVELQPADDSQPKQTAQTAPSAGKKRAHPQTNAAAPSAASASSVAAPRAAPAASAAASAPPPLLHFYGFHLDCWDETEATRMSELHELLQLVTVDADDAIEQQQAQAQQQQQSPAGAGAAAALPPPPPPPIFAVLAGDYNAVRQSDYVQPIPAVPSVASSFASVLSSGSSAASAASARPVWRMLRDVNRALLHQDDLETPTIVHDTLRRRGWIDSFTAAGQAPPNWTAWSGTAVDFIYCKHIQQRGQRATKSAAATSFAAAASASSAAASSAPAPAPSPALRLPLAGSYVLYSAESDHVPIVVDIDLHACAKMSAAL